MQRKPSGLIRIFQAKRHVATGPFVLWDRAGLCPPIVS
jgi:hypothetical protein